MFLFTGRSLPLFLLTGCGTAIWKLAMVTRTHTDRREVKINDPHPNVSLMLTCSQITHFFPHNLTLWSLLLTVVVGYRSLAWGGCRGENAQVKRQCISAATFKALRSLTMYIYASVSDTHPHFNGFSQSACWVASILFPF